MHDFSAAGWLFGSVLLFLIIQKTSPKGKVGMAIADIIKNIRHLMMYCLVGIIVFGVVRAFAYKDFEWSQAAGDAQITLLVVKHILFTGIFIVGLVYYIRAGRFIKEVNDKKIK
jgi:hypothetical protein